MKNRPILSAVILLVLVVAFASCTSMQPVMTDDQYVTNSNTPPSRIYMEDPYNYGRTIILERDPFTGRYYQLASTSMYGVSSYDRYYDRRYDPRYDSRYDRRYNTYPVQQQPSQNDAEIRRKKQEARDAILGPKRSN